MQRQTGSYSSDSAGRHTPHDTTDVELQLTRGQPSDVRHGRLKAIGNDAHLRLHAARRVQLVPIAAREEVVRVVHILSTAPRPPPRARARAPSSNQSKAIAVAEPATAKAQPSAASPPPSAAKLDVNNNQHNHNKRKSWRRPPSAVPPPMPPSTRWLTSVVISAFESSGNPPLSPGCTFGGDRLDAAASHAATPIPPTPSHPPPPRINEKMAAAR